MDAETQPPRLRRSEASEYLLRRHGISRSVNTLARLAVAGGGPVFERFGHTPLYTPESLDAWVASRMSEPLRSTRQAA